MTCSYQLSPGQWVDSVKWYLNSSEIYRIVPSLTLQDRSVYLLFPSFLGLVCSLSIVDVQSVDVPSAVSDGVAASVWPGEARAAPAECEGGGGRLSGSLHLPGHHGRPALLHRPGGGRHDGLPPPGLLPGGEGRPGPLQAGGLAGAQLLLLALPPSSRSRLGHQRSTGRQSNRYLKMVINECTFILFAVSNRNH